MPGKGAVDVSHAYVAILLIDGRKDVVNVYADSVDEARNWLVVHYPAATIKSIN